MNIAATIILVMNLICFGYMLVPAKSQAEQNSKLVMSLVNLLVTIVSVFL